MNNTIIYKELSDRIIGLALEVHRTLGAGLLESAYEEVMCWELKHTGIPFERQKVYPLKYKGDYISSYFADLVVVGKVILEIKSVKAFDKTWKPQAVQDTSRILNLFSWRPAGMEALGRAAGIKPPTRTRKTKKLKKI